MNINDVNTEDTRNTRNGYRLPAGHRVLAVTVHMLPSSRHQLTYTRRSSAMTAAGVPPPQCTRAGTRLGLRGIIKNNKRRKKKKKKTQAETNRRK